ncbi:Fibrinogen- domains (FReDs) [Branchiostoma belcheri]|nr:Fibrinogen- domains (FReDs) [Branchiostoma belcheri]
MSTKKLFPNGEASPEGSAGRHGNRLTNGIVLALSGLAAVVSFVTLMFMVREMASIREQQVAFIRDIRDQVLLIRVKQERETDDKHPLLGENLTKAPDPRGSPINTVFCTLERDEYDVSIASIPGPGSTSAERIAPAQNPKGVSRGRNLATEGVLAFSTRHAPQTLVPRTGPALDVGSTEDWRRDDSATFWKSTEMHRRAKRDSEANSLLIHGKLGGNKVLRTLSPPGGMEETGPKARLVCKARPVQPETQETKDPPGGMEETVNMACLARRARSVHPETQPVLPETQAGTAQTDNKVRQVHPETSATQGGTGWTDNKAHPVRRVRPDLPDSVAVQLLRPRLLRRQRLFSLQEDCAAYKAAGLTTSGVYTLGPPLSGVKVYCDMDTADGGWTVIQRRQDGSVDFNRTWEGYKRGFGNKTGEYWLGNENIHLLTAHKNYRVRFDLQDWEGQTRFAEYSTFRVSGEEDQYQLEISGYSGTAGNSMNIHNNQMFSTVDRDNDSDGSWFCSRKWGGAGWWFSICGYTFLNGRYLGNCGSACPNWQGLVWYHWRGERYSLKSVSMKIRP